MDIHQQKQRDRADIDKLQFKRGDKLNDIFELLYRLLTLVAHKKHHARLRLLIEWFKVPLTLWAVPVDEIARHAVKNIMEKRPDDPQFDFLMELLDNLPGDAALKEISEFEEFVYEGKYEILFRGEAKYKARLKELLRNPLFLQHRARFNELFPFAKFQSPKGILRRTLVPERNLRSDWEYNWSDERKRCQIVLDALCHYWLLYGFLNGEPLLLKPSVNPTPHGVSIFIPAYWNLDPWKDFNWPLVKKLIKCRAREHHGGKRNLASLDRIDECLRTLEAHKSGVKSGYKGERLRLHTVTEARLHADTDKRQVYRNRKDAEKYLAKSKQ